MSTLEDISTFNFSSDHEDDDEKADMNNMDTTIQADEGLFVGYSLSSKAFRVFNSRKRIVKENLHIEFSENIPNVVGTQSNGFAGTKACDNAGQARKEKEPVKD
nr:retrovirus-related Pol polyprotein from transposon TNT 1-94 [Tanacetum cinerariifolium]